MTKELTNKVALVTGGTRGLGRATVEALADAGAKVVFTGRDEATGKAAERAGDTLFAKQDVASDADWQRVMSAAEEAFGRVDIVVGNAGIADPAPLMEMSLDDFRKGSSINLKGAYLAVKYGTIALRKHGEGGSIILTASVMGKVSAPGYTQYSSSKCGVRLLAKSAALELGAEGIRVNALLPGMIRTDMTVGFPEDQVAPMLIPAKRFGLAEEVASTIVFMASDRSKFMTGTDVVLDGGLIAR